MLIKESDLRKIIREELILESLKNTNLINENFLSNISKNLGKVGTAALIAIAAHTSGCASGNITGDVGRLAPQTREIDASLYHHPHEATENVKKALYDYEIAYYNAKTQEDFERLKDTRQSLAKMETALNAVISGKPKTPKNQEPTAAEIKLDKEKAKRAKNEFYVLKGLKNLKNIKNLGVAKAAYGYKMFMTQIGMSYAAKLEAGEISMDQFEKVGPAMKYVGDNMHTKGKFLNRLEIKNYFKDQVGQ